MRHFLRRVKRVINILKTENKEKEVIHLILTQIKKSKVCVLAAIDRKKTSFTKPVGFVGLEKDDVALLQRHIKKDSVLITDGNRTYRNLQNIKLKSLKFGKAENKVYHLNNINNFHSLLKKFMVRFNGVATKYLDYYVEYFKNLKDNIDVFIDNLAIIDRIILCKVISTTRRSRYLLKYYLPIFQMVSK